MSLTLFIDEPCPKCRKPIRQTTIDVHPTNRDLPLHIYECADCGPVKTKIISLKPKAVGQIGGLTQLRRPRCWLRFVL